LTLIACASASSAVADARASSLKLDRRVIRAVAAVTGSRGHYSIDCTYAARNRDAVAYPRYHGRAAQIYMKERICRDASLYAEQKLKPVEGSALSLRTARALLVVTHEFLHISSFSGSRNEALTECQALQIVARVAEQLGASHEQALALARDAVAAHDELLREFEGYANAECRPGGALDLAPETPEWPGG
jgi:hypothetical protein